MGSLNRATLIGNVGKAPEVKTLANGGKVAQFSLATTEPAYTQQNGQRVEARTEWHNVVAWAGLATICERYLTQGAQVYVEGKIRYRTYENQQQQKRYVTEIVAENVVLLKNNNEQLPQGLRQQQAPAPASAYTGMPNSNNEELPY